MSENQIMGAVAGISILALVLISWVRSGALPGANRKVLGGVAVGVALVVIALVAERLLK